MPPHLMSKGHFRRASSTAPAQSSLPQLRITLAVDGVSNGSAYNSSSPLIREHILKVLRLDNERVGEIGKLLWRGQRR